MTALLRTLKTIFPQTPDPPDPGVSAISAALDSAMATHIVTTFVPAGIGSTFLSSLTIAPTPFLQSLASYLDVTISPILSTALGLETNPSSPQPHLLAWFNVQSAFDSLVPAVPPFMSGPQGALFWQAILITIRTVIIPTPPPPPEPPPSTPGGAGVITLEEEI